jgi:hypothetical protein
MGRRQVGGFGDVAHAALREPAVTEDARRGAQDADAPAVAPPRAS